MCRSSKSDASYIVNFDKYEGLVAKIIKKQPIRPIVVFVKMPAVEKAFAKVTVSTANLYVYYSILFFIQQKKNGLFLDSDDEEGDGLGGGVTIKAEHESG